MERISEPGQLCDLNTCRIMTGYEVTKRLTSKTLLGYNNCFQNTLQDYNSRISVPRGFVLSEGKSKVGTKEKYLEVKLVQVVETVQPHTCIALSKNSITYGYPSETLSDGNNICGRYRVTPQIKLPLRYETFMLFPGPKWASNAFFHHSARENMTATERNNPKSTTKMAKELPAKMNLWISKRLNVSVTIACAAGASPLNCNPHAKKQEQDCYEKTSTITELSLTVFEDNNRQVILVETASLAVDCTIHSQTKTLPTAWIRLSVPILHICHNFDHTINLRKKTKYIHRCLNTGNPVLEVRIPELLNQLCNESQGSDTVRRDACYGCFFRASSQTVGYPLLMALSNCANIYLNNTDYGHCQQYLRNATSMTNSRTNPTRVYCTFLECVRQVNKDNLLRECVGEAVRAFPSFNTTDVKLAQLYVNTTACVLAKTRCSQMNPITGEFQEDDLANKLHIPTVNAVLVNTDYDINIVQLPFHSSSIDVLGLTTVTKNVIDDSKITRPIESDKGVDRFSSGKYDRWYPDRFKYDSQPNEISIPQIGSARRWYLANKYPDIRRKTARLVPQYDSIPLLLYSTPPHESRDSTQPIANFRCISVAPEEARFSGLPPVKSLSVIKKKCCTKFDTKQALLQSYEQVLYT
ncbi:hypothetical protein WN51_07761 [Melipona quadrifasciata]|uniref:Uncharacterized protein n=1 Tax=Melipona quadrifasciata TaxID=166423 RepID=A0A0M9A6P4_9HYME|nr:hypothetical protein WN51_07761 [Melipona quadrifasciata]